MVSAYQCTSWREHKYVVWNLSWAILGNLSKTSVALEEKIAPMASFSDETSGLIHFVIA